MLFDLEIEKIIIGLVIFAAIALFLGYLLFHRKKIFVEVKSDPSFLAVKGAGEYKMWKRVRLEATPRTDSAVFDGWFDSKNMPMGKKPVLTFLAVEDTVFEARFHRVYADGKEPMQTVTFSWDYRGTDIDLRWKIRYSEYCQWHNSNVCRSPNSKRGSLLFVDYKSRALVSLADSLKSMSSKMSRAERADFVLSFVQKAIGYEYDEVHHDSEYWKYPVESLFEKSGDCEDHAILYCSLMKAMGENMALLILPGHAAAGAGVPGVTGDYYYVDGIKYYYCETTGRRLHVGERWKEYSEGHVLVIP